METERGGMIWCGIEWTDMAQRRDFFLGCVGSNPVFMTVRRVDLVSYTPKPEDEAMARREADRSKRRIEAEWEALRARDGIVKTFSCISLGVQSSGSVVVD